MGEVKRYDPINSDGTCGMCIEDAGYGAYVEYADYAALEAELAKLRAGQEPVAFYWQDVGYENPNMHGPYFGRPTEAALRNVDGGAIPVLLYTTPQPVAVPDGWKLVPVEPTPEMVSAAEEAHMPFGDMDIALRMAILSAPSAPKADDPVKVQLLEALESAADALARAEFFEQADNARSAISAVREEVMK